MNDIEREQIDRVDDAVKSVAARMPFPVTVDAEMGGTFLLQVDLGSRFGEDGERDRAMIGTDPGEHWWVDLKDGGVEQVESTLTIDSDPAEVAAWIAQEARRAGSPAALTVPAYSSPDFPSAPGGQLGSQELRPPRSTARGSDSGLQR